MKRFAILTTIKSALALFNYSAAVEVVFAKTVATFTTPEWMLALFNYRTE